MAKATKSKTVQLTKADKFYIDNKCDQLSLTEISSDLGYSESTVEGYYTECLDKVKRADTIDKLMVVNSKNGYAVMTREASEKGESTRKKSTAPPENHIHKIRPER